MPAKNAIKEYTPDGYYHIYNRGVEKRIIFQEPEDYQIFIRYLSEYLLPKDIEELRNQISKLEFASTERDKIIKQININNFSDEISLLCYSLMPNHFHFLVKQQSFDSINHFMRSFSTRYTAYFNRKYNRVGPLYQGVYKAVMVKTDEQLLHLSRYIHHQALYYQEGMNLNREQPSSFYCYLNKEQSNWIDTTTILSFFNKNSSNPLLNYEGYVRNVIQPLDLTVDSNLIIE